jgi:uncharacterized membrane protein HdeD (DUF308 family)
MQRLARNWWVIVARGVFAAAFGVALLSWIDITLQTVVVLFAIYALLDGSWTLASAVALSSRSIGRLAVGAEGVVSVVLGALALAWPSVPREHIELIAGWGIATGLLELIAAAALPDERAGHWLLGTAGVSSLFLAVMLFVLPTADAARTAAVLGGYALIFGAMMAWAAVWFRGAYGAAARMPARRRAA